MEVGGTHRSAPGGPEQVANRPVGGDGVGGRTDRPEREIAPLIREEMAAVGGAPPVVLDVIETVLVGPPDLQPGAAHRGTAEAADDALHEARLPRRAQSQVAAQIDLR